MLEIADVHVHFGGVVAVDGVSLSVHRGEIHGLVGPNGSGKTTLLNAVTGVVSARGRMTVAGKPVSFGKPLRSRAEGVLRMFQAPQTFAELSCLENALLAAAGQSVGLGGAWFTRPLMWRHERERWALAYAALRRVGLAELADEPADRLTYGQQRLLELARALTAQPRLLLLDEPSAGLNDNETANLATLCASLRSEDGLTLIIIDHKIDFLDGLCDRISVLELGRCIATGTPVEIWSDPRVIDAYLGGPANA